MKNITTTNQPSDKSGRLTTHRLVLISMVTAITCVLAPFAIPIPVSPVPISLTNLVLLISVYILGWKDASISYFVYLLLGAAGLPVGIGRLHALKVDVYQVLALSGDADLLWVDIAFFV